MQPVSDLALDEATSSPVDAAGPGEVRIRVGNVTIWPSNLRGGEVMRTTAAKLGGMACCCCGAQKALEIHNSNHRILLVEAEVAASVLPLPYQFT